MVFLKVLFRSTPNDEHQEEERASGKAIFASIETSVRLNLMEMKARESFTRASPRYTEAALVEKLEELEFGRPSHYAPNNLLRIQNWNMVIKESRDGNSCEILVEMNHWPKAISTEATKTENTGAREKQKLFHKTCTGGQIDQSCSDSHFRKCDLTSVFISGGVEKEFEWL